MLPGVTELITLVQAFADIIVSQEYGIEAVEKMSIGTRIAHHLMRKIFFDMTAVTVEETLEEEQTVSEREDEATPAVAAAAVTVTGGVGGVSLPPPSVLSTPQPAATARVAADGGAPSGHAAPLEGLGGGAAKGSTGSLSSSSDGSDALGRAHSVGDSITATLPLNQCADTGGKEGGAAGMHNESRGVGLGEGGGGGGVSH